MWQQHPEQAPLPAVPLIAKAMQVAELDVGSVSRSPIQTLITILTMKGWALLALSIVSAIHGPAVRNGHAMYNATIPETKIPKGTSRMSSLVRSHTIKFPTSAQMTEAM
jgi:hypothetical protein